MNWENILNKEAFEEISQKYYKSFNFGLMFFTENRIVFNNCKYYNWPKPENPEFNYIRMITESDHWGEPYITIDKNNVFIWCAPVTLNNIIIGGFFSASDNTNTDKNISKNVRLASWELFDLLTEYNLCNKSRIQLNSMINQIDAKKAEAIRLYKGIYYQNPRDIYMIEERSLLNAVKHGDFERARKIINKIIVGVYNVNNDFNMLKALVLEMVVQMYRSVIDEGADPKELLGVNSTFLSDFHKLQTEQELDLWLIEWLEEFIKTSIKPSNKNIYFLLQPAIKYMKNNLAQPLSRDDVAKVCNLSPGYFSRLIKDKTGYTFTDLLTKFRLEQACFLLDTTNMNILQVSFESGFSDPSYFTKTFKKFYNITPKEYLKEPKNTKMRHDNTRI